jgi:hypothetical protein
MVSKKRRTAVCDSGTGTSIAVWGMWLPPVWLAFEPQPIMHVLAKVPWFVMRRNPLKSSGSYAYHQLQHRNFLNSGHRVLLCFFVWFSKPTATLPYIALTGQFFHRICNVFPVRYVICYHIGIVFGFFFDPEDGGGIFLRNVSLLPTDYTALYPRR